LIGFARAKLFINSDGEHIPFRNDNQFLGLKFTAMNALLGYEMSRRDDLELIGLIIIYLLKGEFPWSS